MRGRIAQRALRNASEPVDRSTALFLLLFSLSIVRPFRSNRMHLFARLSYRLSFHGQRRIFLPIKFIPLALQLDKVNGGKI